MKRAFAYFRAQLKRCIAFWPRILLLTLASALCIGCFAASMFQRQEKESKEALMKIKIGVCGDLTDTYLDLAVFALQNFDSSQYYAEMISLDESEAEDMLRRGELIGYVIVPDGYVESVISGEELQVTYVLNDSPAAIVPMLIKEVIETVSHYVVESETSIYSFTRICRERGIPRSEYRPLADNMSLECLARILDRSSAVSTELSQGEKGLDYENYYICAFFILILLLWGMTWAPLFIKKDGLLLKLMYFRRTGAVMQTAGEFFAYFIISALNLLLAFGLFYAAFSNSESGIAVFHTPGPLGFIALFGKLLLVQLLVCALQYFMFELCRSIISGILLQLVATVVLSHVSGFFYPKQSLPESIAAFGELTPTGCAFSYMTDIFANRSPLSSALFVLLWAAVFISLSCIVRMRKIRGVEE